MRNRRAAITLQGKRASYLEVLTGMCSAGGRGVPHPQQLICAALFGASEEDGSDAIAAGVVRVMTCSRGQVLVSVALFYFVAHVFE
jgi:hypothetical protein